MQALTIASRALLDLPVSRTVVQRKSGGTQQFHRVLYMILAIMKRGKIRNGERFLPPWQNGTHSSG
jgi:hypothetical protein